MKVMTSLAAAAVLAFGATVVLAQQNPIEARKAIMKANGSATGGLARMVKGEAPFDLAAAKKAFAEYQNSAEKMPGLFPENSKTGGDTTASPKIWEDQAGFKAAFAKFGAEAKAAEASVKDLDSLKAAFGTVTRNCGSCHETYRVKKS